MTETSPVASVGRIKSSLEAKLSDDEKAELRTTVGQIALGVDFRVVDPVTLEAKPWDGETSRRAPGARARGSPATYYNDDRSARVVHRRRLAAHRRHGGRRRPTATSSSSTAPRT